MLKIYLDTNVWSRPFDAQTQERIRKEIEAFFEILHMLDEERIDIVGSIVLEDEINRIVGVNKRAAVSELIYWSITHKVVDIPIIYREIAKLGLTTRDSAHIACAINGGAGYFITVDDDILRRKDKIEDKYGIRVCSPVEFIKEVG